MSAPKISYITSAPAGTVANVIISAVLFVPSTASPSEQTTSAVGGVTSISGSTVIVNTTGSAVQGPQEVVVDTT